ncbi:MAG: ATP-binding protein [Crenarchaeota archaeon]|nr:ATP-binding protein [Thermoproteota archaeon]
MSSGWRWRCEDLGKLVGVVTSGARSSVVPIRVVKEAIPFVKDEMLVLVDDMHEDRRFLGAVKSSVKLDIAIDADHLPTSFSPETTLRCSTPLMKTYVEIFGEVTKSGSLELSFAIPRPGSHVYLVENGPALAKVLRLPQGLTVGEHKFSRLVLHLDPRALDYHIAVVGATGTGKSRLVKAIVEEVLLKTGYSVIVFDHTGVDYSDPSRWGRVRAAGIEPKIVDASRIILDPVTVHELMVEKARVPRTLEDHVFFSIVRYIQDRVAQSEGTRAKIDGSTASSLAQEIERCIEKYFEISKTGETLWDFASFLDGMYRYLDDLNARESTKTKLAVLLSLGLGRSFFERYLGSRNVDIRDLVAEALDGASRLIVIDMSTEVEYVAKRFIVAQALRWLWNKVLSERRRANVVVVVDEAHNYACQRCDPSVQEIEKTAREGRKWGIGLILASQRIRDLSADARGNINTVFFSRLQTYSDYQELRGWIEGAQYMEYTLPLLAPREFFVAGLANPLRRPVLIKVRSVD